MNSPPLIIPVFIPHSGCPHQCVFCNQNTITGHAGDSATPHTVKAIVERYLGYAGKRRGHVEIAFYGGTFLGLAPDYTKTLLDAGQAFVDRGLVHGMRFSTRPDTVTNASMDLIRPFSVSTIELGVQSMDDHVLRLSGRGHTAAQGDAAALEIKERGYRLGLQMMTGLPGDSFERAIETGRRIAGLSPDFVRIYPTVVVAGSPLADLYEQGRYVPQQLGDTVQLVKRLYLLFHHREIQVIRMGLQPSSDLTEGSSILGGPFHEAFGHLVFSALFLDMADKILDADPPEGTDLIIRVNRSSISKMRGLSNANIIRLKEKYGYEKISVRPDPDIGKEMVGIQGTVLSFSHIASPLCPAP